MPPPRIALNGLGRIGKLVLRNLIDTGAGGEIVLMNDPMGDPDQHALLMEFDSVHGRWHTPVAAAQGALVLDGRPIRLTHAQTIEALPLAEMGVDLVIDCTGVFKTGAKLAPYFAAGVQKLVVSAPIKEEGALNLVYGINHHLFDGSQKLVTAASCTTNCLAPVAWVLNETFGIERGYMTTIHAYTGDQKLHDNVHKDLRRARAGALSMIPTSTGAARAVGLVLPELKGKLDGTAIRVPTANVSVIDLKFNAKRKVSAEEINAAMREAAAGKLKGILGVNDEDLVSIDFNHSPYSSVFDLTQTQVVDGSLVRVMSWYDNEWGFSNRMSDTAVALAATI